VSFPESGFLAADNTPVAVIRRRYERWFALISKINTFAMSVLTREVPKVPAELYAAALYARAVTMFQGAVLLAERGMGAEARTLVRGCAETAIALGCTRRDATFLKQLGADHDKHRIASANELLQLPESDPNIGEFQRQQLRQVVADVSAAYPAAGPRRINWATASSAASMVDLYITVYRQTSADAAHVTLTSLDRHVRSDSAGEILGFQFRPNTEETVDSLSMAIAVLLKATEAKIFGLQDVEAEGRLGVFIDEWQALIAAGDAAQEAGRAENAKRA
jgi:hypothetical protein